MSSNERIGKVLTVAFALCIVCSVVVSTAAVVLKPAQEANKSLDRKRNILQAAGMLEEGRSVEEQFEAVRVPVPFERKTVTNEALPAGETRLIQLGVNGEDEITYRITGENGVYTDFTGMVEVPHDQSGSGAVDDGDTGYTVEADCGDDDKPRD